MKYTSFHEQRFRDSVAKAMDRVRSILDRTRNPRLSEFETDHTYADKFALAEFCTNTAIAAQMNALERLGLDGDKLQTVVHWVHNDHKSVTLRFEASDACAFFKERDVEVVTGEREIETSVVSTGNSSGAPGSSPSPSSASTAGGFLSSMTGVVSSSPAAPTTTKTETTKVKVVTKIKEYHWKVDVTYRIIAFAGTDPAANPIELLSRSTSTFVITSGGQSHPGGIMPRGSVGKPPTPIPESTVHRPIDVNLTWFFLRIEPKEQLCQFQIDRMSVKAIRTCKTPRRNDDVDGAMEFYQRLHDWCHRVQLHLRSRVEGQIAGAHRPAQRTGVASTSPETVELGSRGTIFGLQKEPTFNGKLVVVVEYSPDQNRFRVEPVDKTSGLPATLLIKPQNLRIDQGSTGPNLDGVTTESLFCPVLPLMENSAVFGDVGELLNEQCRALDGALDALTKVFPPKQLVKLVSVAEASIVLVAQHLQDLCTSYQDSVDYVENMLKQQLVQAIGKEIVSRDFDQFMVFHNRKLYGPDYAPIPFTYSVRRPGHFPAGIFTIECTRYRNEPIHTMVRRIPSDAAPSMYVPISAATSVELSGDRYLHGWMLHRFKTKPQNDYELVARARQFSSFLVVIGTMQGPDRFDPKDAIILQNKDEVMIPLLATALPSAKEFKDSIASLSPEQKAFAQAYRSMQLESSVFGLCIIELKPQLERLLGLPEGALTKEIQLTQDLTSLFIDYQIPSDLLSFDGPDASETSVKVDAVKGYVKSIMEVIDSSKEKQLIEEERRADMRLEMTYPTGQEMLASSAHAQAAFAPFSMPFGESSEPMLTSSAHAQTAFAPSSMLFGASNEPKFGASSEPKFMMAKGGTRGADLADGNRNKSRARFAMKHSMGKTFNLGPAMTAPPAATAASSGMQQSSIPSTNVRLENVQPRSPQASAGKGGRGSGRGGSSAPSPPQSEDFTLIPKLLDDKLERFDTDGALRSTVIKAGSPWTLNRQENLLTASKTLNLAEADIESEKKKAFDLLDAISRSGALPISSSELHVVVGVSHCFDNDVMGSIIQDNVNPIEKVEKSSLMVASAIYGKPPMSLIGDGDNVQRLTASFPELASNNSQVEIFADQD